MARQDPSVEHGGYRQVWVPYTLRPGPATDDVMAVNNMDLWKLNPVSTDWVDLSMTEIILDKGLQLFQIKLTLKCI